MARRLGSAMMAKADSITGIYLYGYIPVKSCLGCSSNNSDNLRREPIERRKAALAKLLLSRKTIRAKP
jgi:hypothetical protein